MVEYGNREYCKNIKCPIQIVIKDKPYKADLTKEICRNECKAYDFHKWLEKNNYKIIKGV